MYCIYKYIRERGGGGGKGWPGSSLARGNWLFGEGEIFELTDPGEMESSFSERIHNPPFGKNESECLRIVPHIPFEFEFKLELYRRAIK